MPRHHVTIELEPLEETELPEDSIDDPQTVELVYEEIRRGNRWAWFVAKVTAGMRIGTKEFEGTNYLGACSYKNKTDFMSPDGYWPDLQSEAIDDLVRELDTKRVQAELKRLGIDEDVRLGIVEARVFVEVHRRGLWLTDKLPDRLLRELGVPCFDQNDEGACQVLFDALADEGLLTDVDPGE